MRTLLFFLLPFFAWLELPVEVFRGENGTITLRSDAPLEVIEAQSAKLRGIIDPAAQTFAWSVEVKTFEGFNSPLQQEHFHENYMETRKFPKATFSGKIIETVDFKKDGTYTVRAKGKLVIHGIEQERIIKSKMTIKGNSIAIKTSFSVPLTDHSITVPKIVNQKISEEIFVIVEADLKKQ